MDVAQFDFDLPEDRIALRPLEPREAAKLLVVAADGALQDRTVRDFPNYLRPGDVLVLNNTRVLPTQLFGQKGEAKIGATLVRRVGNGVWWAFVRNAKRLKTGDEIDFGHGLRAAVEERNEDGQILLKFSGFEDAFEFALERYGAMPLPPYIAARRAADTQDRRDYQTSFARHDGSVAAPTAGLHFSKTMLDHLHARGIEIAEVTLHVGAGTFLPVKVADTQAHKMHPEWGQVCSDVAARINMARQRGGRIICVGTTSVRLLESAADESGTVHAFSDETAIFITPGYRFKTADMLLTNFHLPKSTLFMLVSAFSGLDAMKAAYAHAIAKNYRFYSYGDACLLMRG